MKRLHFMLLLILSLTIFTSCGKQETEQQNEKPHAYYEGYDDGTYNTFIDLWYSIPDYETLSPGDIWETSDFTLKLDDNDSPSSDRMGGNIHAFLNVNNYSLHSCFSEEGKMFLYAFANDTGRELLTGFTFFDSVIFETPWKEGGNEEIKSSHYGQMSFDLYDQEDSIAIIISINGNIYRAFYLSDIQNSDK